jgi:hypothetical protein
MRLSIRTFVLGAGAASMLAACSTDLAVTNPNAGNITQALARPTDVENLLGGGFNSIVNGTTGGGNDNINNSLQVMSHENYTGLANFNMGPRAGLPRTPILNFPNNPGTAAANSVFIAMSRAARSTVIAFDRLTAPGFTLGSQALDLRARAYGRFVLGVALGNLALTYDSAAVVVPGGEAVPPLVAYDSVGRAAIAQLDLALADASNPAATQALPVGWLNLSVPVTQDLFVRIIRSYRARLRASIGRTPAERGAANWAAILADATNGIQGDVLIAMNPASGWTQAWVIQHYVGTNWHVMTPFVAGMADTTGAYTTWLNEPLLNRTPFLIRTPDRRWPSGETRAAQNTASGGGQAGTVPPAAVYFRNRVSQDDGAAADGTWGFSWYDHARFQAFQNASRIGNFPHITIAEMNGLIAEASIRAGDFATAATAIDRSRVSRGGLPALSGAGITSLTQPVPGGAACVPRVPVRSATGTFTTQCGNIWEAMKWEKRMEMAYTSYGAWYFDSRGWGDLPEGTPVHFTVPWGEQDIRLGKPSNTGGVGQPGGAARGTYGFP